MRRQNEMQADSDFLNNAIFKQPNKIEKLRGSMILPQLSVCRRLSRDTYARVLTNRISLRNLWSCKVQTVRISILLNFQIAEIHIRTVGSHVIKNFGEKVRRKIQERAYYMLHSMLLHNNSFKRFTGLKSYPYVLLHSSLNAEWLIKHESYSYLAGCLTELVWSVDTLD